MFFPFQLNYRPFVPESLRVSRVSCLLCSRGIRAPGSTCSRASRASCPTCSLPHTSRTLGALVPLAPHFRCLMSNISSYVLCLIVLLSCASCVFGISAIWVFLQHGLRLITMIWNFYWGKCITKAFYTWYKPQGSINMPWFHHFNASTRNF